MNAAATYGRCIVWPASGRPTASPTGFCGIRVSDRSRLMATAGGGAVATWLGGQDLPFRIWDSKRRRWWGDLYQHCPDDLLDELNGEADYQKITALLKRYRAEKR